MGNAQNVERAFATWTSARALAIALLATGASPAAAQAPAFVVKDVATQVQVVSGRPLQYVTIGTTTFFQGRTATTGQELWKTDGTTAGTTLVKDLLPGSGSGVSGSSPFYDFPTNQMAAIGGVLLFTGQDGVSGRELYLSDGTAAGTGLLKDINPFGESNPQKFTLVDGTLFFAADDGVHGRELWKSDGTTAGTVLVKDIVAGPGGSFGFDSSEELVDLNGLLLFTVNDGVNGRELWRSDGTAAGTVLVKDIAPGALSSTPDDLTPVAGVVLFAADDGTNGKELWRSDGTLAGTVLVMDVAPGSASGVSAHLTNVNGTVFFGGNDGTSGGELWKSDGTTAGTVLVKDIVPGTGSSFPSRMAAMNGTLFFSAADPASGRELWKSDGTAAGTTLVKDANPGTAGSSPEKITAVGGRIFFRAADAANGIELWVSDGTAAGTMLVRDINPGPHPASAFSSLNSPGDLTNANGTLLFIADDGVNGQELWRSDGTTAGTVLVRDIGVDIGSGLGSNLQVDVNGTLFFRAGDSGTNQAIWKSDGTAAGTMLVASFGRPLDLRSSGGLLYARTPTGGPSQVSHTLFRSDGTPGGTFALGIGAGPVTDVNGTAFFRSGGIFQGPLELRKTDGTVAGTVVVKAFPTAVEVGDDLVDVNGTVFFTVWDSGIGRELWKSDGTDAGTVLVKDIRPGNAASAPGQLTNVDGTLFFTADDGTSGVELWKSDGTPDGTVLVADIDPGAGSSNPAELTAVNGTLFFSASDAASGTELWRSDGTAAGTSLVEDILPGPATSWIGNITAASGAIFFAAFDGVSGLELWRSDGTAEGTALVKDINPGFPSSFPEELRNVAGRLVFRACDAMHGCEIWESDGTAAGTQLLAEIVAGTGDGNPTGLTRVGSLIFFTAYDDAVGRELWALPASTIPGGVQSACLVAKNKCMSATARRRLECEQRATTPGKPTDPNTRGCIDRANAGFDGGGEAAKACFARFEAKASNDCVTSGDTGAGGVAIDDCIGSLVAAIDPPPREQTKCGAGKTKCTTVLLKRLLGCYRQAETPGRPVEPMLSECLARARARFDGGASPARGCFAKLEAKPGNDCLPPLGNTPSVRTVTGDCATSFVRLLETPTTP